MSHLPPAAQEALEAFRSANGWEARARLLLHYGGQLAVLAAEQRIPANQVHGCESEVWLVAHLQDGIWQFQADSSARLLRGLLRLLLLRIEGLNPAELAQVDLNQWFQQLGLERQLSPSRSNGLNAVLLQMRHLSSPR